MYYSKLLVVGLLAALLLSGSFVQAGQYFEARVSYLVGDYPTRVVAYDLNDDTSPDMIVANDYSNNISVLIGNGDGTFAGRLNYALTPNQYPSDVTVGDMDGDGAVDLITGGIQGIDIFYGVGDGTFGAAVFADVSNVNVIAVDDFDGDGLLDIAATNKIADSVGIHINNGDSTFTSAYVTTAYGSYSILAGKFDIDAYPDLVVTCENGTQWNLRNDGSGGFTPAVFHTDTCAGKSYLAAADFNGNGVNDLAVANQVTDSVTIFLNNGDGTYAVSHNFYAGGEQPVALILTDVDADSEPDMLIASWWDANIKCHLGGGNGTFAFDPWTYYAGSESNSIFAEDVDGDGFVDLLATSTANDSAAVFISRMSLLLDVSDSDNTQGLPTLFSLEQNYPNPFNPETRIRFALPQASEVRVEVFNVLGQSVTVLVDDYLSAGMKEVTWNGLNATGQQAASGIYLYRLTADRLTDSKTMVLLK